MFPLFCKKISGMLDFSSLIWFRLAILRASLTVFMSKLFSYLTRIFWILSPKSGFGYLHATSVSRQIWNCFYLYSIPFIFFHWFGFDLVRSGFVLSKGMDSNKNFVIFFHSCVNFSVLKCATFVFREPNCGCLCSCGGIPISLTILPKQAISLI